MKRILVYRFSAMGDVVMLLPVLKGLLDSNPDLEIHLLTRSFLFPVFKGIDRLHLVTADLNGEHKGMKGLHRLYKKIKQEINPELVFDLHQVLRTYNLNLFFRLGGTKVVVFEKGQIPKRWAVLTKSHKVLPTTIDRYANTFTKAGLRVQLPKPPLFGGYTKTEILKILQLEPAEKVCLIGIAPFAKHPQKIWGKEKVRELMQKLGDDPANRFVLFGGGKEEINILSELAAEFRQAVVAGKLLKLDDELKILPNLDVMLTMDSANMHLAAMAGIPVVSVWGATHPSLGFAPFGQSPENMIQYEGQELNCRPCSVYGNKKCKYGDVRCMEYIAVERVEKRIRRILGTN